MSDFWQWLMDYKGQALLSGALGGVMRTITLRERVWPDAAINVLGGGISALYLTPIVEPVLRPMLGSFVVAPDGISGFSGFVVGLGGVAATGFILDIWQAWRRKASSEGGGSNDAG